MPDWPYFLFWSLILAIGFGLIVCILAALDRIIAILERLRD